MVPALLLLLLGAVSPVKVADGAATLVLILDDDDDDDESDCCNGLITA